MRSIFNILLFIITISLSGLFTSCNDDLNYTTNPNDKLHFSTDTIKFDTVFTTIGSSTRQFKVFNRSTKPIMIASIRLADASSNRFSVVVDGRRGTSFSNVEIGAKDSMYVFVEVKIDPNNQYNPLLVEDSLVFTTNGNVQRVRFEAYGQNMCLLRGRTLKNDTTFTKLLPILIFDSLIVDKSSTLTLEEGTRLYFHDKAFCRIDGRIVSNGSVSKPVVFRGDRLDNLFPDLPYDLYTGLWKGVSISTGSFGNMMKHTQIRNGEYALRLDSVAKGEAQTTITLTNCRFNNVVGTVFATFNNRVDAYGCEFANGGKDVVALTGGNYKFVHCTFMNNFLFSTPTYTTPSAVRLCNYKLITGNGWDIFPLYKADFLNCLFWGRRSTEINEDIKKNNSATNPYNYLFSYCLIKANGTDDLNFVQTVWNKDPKFVNAGNEYRFDLRLDTLSEAADKGYLGHLTNECFVDMYGVNRLTTDGKPDIGAYERLPKK